VKSRCGHSSAVRAARQDPAASQMRAAPDPPGSRPGGLGPHLTSSGFLGGLSSGFPFARRVLPFVRLPWFPFVRRSPVRSLRPLPGSGSPSVSLRVPFPRAIFTLAPPRGGPAGDGPGRQGPRSSVLPRPCRHLARTLSCGGVQAGSWPAVIIAWSWHQGCGRRDEPPRRVTRISPGRPVTLGPAHRPAEPSMASRGRSACPLRRAYSSTRCPRCRPW